MQWCFHLHLSSTKFAQKYVGKLTLMEGKGTGHQGRCSLAIPEYVPPSKVASEAPSMVLPTCKKGWRLPGFWVVFAELLLLQVCPSFPVSALEGMDNEQWQMMVLGLTFQPPRLADQLRGQEIQVQRINQPLFPVSSFICCLSEGSLMRCSRDVHLDHHFWQTGLLPSL